MIRHGSTETVRRAVVLLQSEDHHRSLEDERRLTDRRLLKAIASLDDPLSIRPDHGAYALCAGDVTHAWSATPSVGTQGMELAIGTPDGGSLTVRTGPLPEASPFAVLSDDPAELARLTRTTLSAARATLSRIVAGNVVPENDPIALRPLLDAACVVTSQVHGEDRERVLLSPRTPFAPLSITSFAAGQRLPVDGGPWEAEVRPAFRVRVSHHPNGTRIRFDALLLSCDEVSPMEVMRAHARHAAATATPWWA